MSNLNVKSKSSGCCGRADDSSDESSPEKNKKRILIACVSACILTSGLILEFILHQRIAAQILFLIVYFLSGKDIIKQAFRVLIKKRRLGMSFLMALAGAGAFLIGHGEEGAAVMFLFFIAERLEEYASERAQRSISELLKLTPEIARVKKDGQEYEVHTHEIEIGDIIVVRPGERIPLDGKINRGSSNVDQATITGESLPIEKQEGDDVFGGTINQDGYLEVKVSKRSEEGMLARITKLVKETEAKKSKSEAFIEKFAAVYTPVVIVLAVGVATIPTLVLGLPLTEWIYRSLVLLVVACPCALAISTPVSMVSAITSATRRGVLIKGSTYLEELNRVKAFAFDKTGTLTEGKLEVSDVVTLNQINEREILILAASLEQNSEHPLARAIVDRARKESLKFIETKDFKAFAGKGISAVMNGKRYHVGARNLFKDLNVGLPEEKIRRYESEGKTTVLLSENNKLLGMIAVRDKIRDSSQNLVKELKERDIHAEMITGDNRQTAAAIAKEIGIEKYQAELLPEDKVKVIEQLMQRFGTVAMVGDGVNDAPSLAKSSVGIAMGAVGSDVALETADIALMKDDLSKIMYLIHLAKQTAKVIRQNVFASILIKGSVAILAFLGMINLWVAVAVGDMGLSLAVIANAMRLAKIKE
jgi:Cd2+/Zn2+-exporting ATPase